jgi:DNA-binding CsgD family transcriptional regulator
MNDASGGGVRLSDAQVVELREQYEGGARQVDLAKAYGVRQNTVSALVLGRTRAAAGGPIAAPTASKPKKAATQKPANASARRAPLTIKQVDDIRARVEGGQARAAVAAALGVSIHTVHSIMSGRRSGRSEVPARQFSEDDVVRMRTLFKEGASQSDLAEQFGTQQQAVSQIVRGKTYADVGGPIAKDS